MILDKILDAVFSFLMWVANLLPSWNPGHATAFQDVVNFLSGCNAYFPLTEVVESMGIILAVEGMIIMWRPILKFIRVA